MDGMSADKISDVRYPGRMRENFRPGGMNDATYRKGPFACPREREPCGTFLGRIPQVGGFSADHHLGSGWLCKRFRGVMGGCITTKGKTAG